MITVKELTKRYGAHTAVDALSFTVDKGQIYGLLGPNGAGKSTTMNIITGYISATDGTAEIDGCDIFDSPAEARAKIGYLPEQPPLYTDMTPREYLAFAAELKGLPREQRKAAVEQCMERTNIADVADRLIRNLSKGYRQRVGLACALLGDPPVIILDEPTVGLDPKQIIEIRELIRSLGQEQRKPETGTSSRSQVAHPEMSRLPRSQNSFFRRTAVRYNNRFRLFMYQKYFSRRTRYASGEPDKKPCLQRRRRNPPRHHQTDDAPQSPRSLIRT